MTELVNRSLVVRDGDALAKALSELPFLDVVRKNYKFGNARDHDWRIRIKRKNSLLNQLRQSLELDTIAYIAIRKDKQTIVSGNDFSPLRFMNKLPTFEAVRVYLKVMEEHVDKNYDYKAERKKVNIMTACAFLSIAITIPLVYFFTITLETFMESLSIATLLYTLGWLAVAAFVFSFSYENFEALFFTKERKWWIPATYIKRVRKHEFR